jgi:hypothetical protein
VKKKASLLRLQKGAKQNEGRLYRRAAFFVYLTLLSLERAITTDDLLNAVVIAYTTSGFDDRCLRPVGFP